MALKKLKKKIGKKFKSAFASCRSNELVVDINSGSAQDIFNLYKLNDEKCQLAYGYMSMQREIDEKMRTVLVDWLIKAHMQYKLEQETLYLSIDIIDRFLSKEIVPLVELKLLGFTALFLACKYEEGTPLKVGSNIWTAWRKDYLQLSDRTFTPQQVYDLEEKILRKLGWNLAVITTPYHFIHHYLEASTKSDAKMKNMVCFLMELALIHYETIKYSPSTIAASAVYVALCTLHQKPNWSKKLKLYTGYSMEQLRDCIWLVEKLHKMPWKDMPKAIHGKYSVPARDRVSLLPPAGSGYQHFHFKWDLRRRK